MAQRLADTERSSAPDEDPFLKTTCVYSVGSCMILIIVFFVTLPGALMPYLARVSFIKQVPKVEGLSQTKAVKGPLLICQVDSASFKREVPWTYAPSHIPEHLCSHLVLTVDALPDFFNNIINYDSFADAPAPNHHTELLALRSRRPRLRILAGIGTFQDASPFLEKVAGSPLMSAGFPRSLLRWSLFHKLDGILLSGLFPVRHRKDRNVVVRLLKKLATHFRHREFLVVIPPEAKILKHAWAGKRISHLADLVVVPPRWLGREKALQTLASSGIAMSQLVVAVNFGGVRYSLNHREITHSINDTRLDPYYNICGRQSWKRIHDGELALIHKGSSWEMVEDVKSLSAHVSRLMRQGVAGVMAWDISTDDFLGFCGTKNILLETVRNVTQHAMDSDGDDVAAATTTNRSMTT